MFYGLEFLGDMSTRLLIAAAFAGMLLDIASGFAQAVKNDELSSEKMRLGLWHKCGFAGLIVLGIYLQWVQNLADISSYIGMTIPTTAALCIYIVACEVISIKENLSRLNPQIDDSPLGELGHHDSI